VILFELTQSETNPVYQALEIANGNRQYDFLHSIVNAALAMGRPFLSRQIIRALNYHAIACLHTHAGQYRPCPVTVGTYIPPDHYRVQALMDDFVNTVNRHWAEADQVVLASYVLWRMNYIHPFINGNGRTARAACYFVLCVKSGGLLPGDRTLPELIKQNRDEYVAALRAADASVAGGRLDLLAMHGLLTRLIGEQLASAGIDVVAEEEVAAEESINEKPSEDQ
jgi:Fic family protein